jgi:serine protease Do
VRPVTATPLLGIGVRDLDRATAERLRLPRGIEGVVVTRVEPLSSAYDVGIQRDHILLEINRRPVATVDDFNRVARTAGPGDVLAVYVYMPGTEQRAIRAIRVAQP